MPESEKDWVAQLLLDSLRDEREWGQHFAESEEMLASLGKKHWASIRLGVPGKCEQTR